MSSDPEAGKKLRQAIDEYAQRQPSTSTAEPSTIDLVLSCFVPEQAAADQLRALIVDHVFRYLFSTACQIYQRVEGREDQFDDGLDHFLRRKTRLTPDNVPHFRRYLKQAVLTSRSPRPKNEVRSRLLSKQRKKRCYICGAAIVPIDNERLDHRWPASAGGGTGRSNLVRAHVECEAAKADLAVSGDAPVGRFAFTKLPRRLEDPPESWWPRQIRNNVEFNELFDDIRSAQLRIALLSRQNFKCFRCEGELSTVGEASLTRKNDDEPWWFPNTVIVCRTCLGDA